MVVFVAANVTKSIGSHQKLKEAKCHEEQGYSYEHAYEIPGVEHGDKEKAIANAHQSRNLHIKTRRFEEELAENIYLNRC